MSLFDAIEKGKVDRVRKELLDGADLEELDEATGMTPLAFAAEAGRLEIVRLLLRVGADPDHGGTTTPLATAVLEGRTEVVRALLAGGADVDRAVADGFTPLMTAASTDDVELVDVLLEAGADGGLVNADGESAIEIALAAGHEAVIERLVRAHQSQAGEDDAAAEPTIFDAIARRDLHTVQDLLDAETPPDLGAFDPLGWTALGRAARQGHADVVAALLEAGADADEGGVEPPLYVAARDGYRDVVELLLEEDATVDTEGGERTPLAAAARGGHDAIVELLLEAGADPSRRDADGRSPLDLAALEGRRRVFALLLPRYGDDARAAARCTLAETLGRRLRAVSETADLVALVERGETTEVERLVREGDLDLDAFDEQGRSLLVAAAEHGRRGLVRTLLDAGAAIDARDDGPDGRTALIQAIRSGRHEVAQLLVDAGADVDRPCGRGWTPIMYAVDVDARDDVDAGPPIARAHRPGGSGGHPFGGHAGPAPNNGFAFEGRGNGNGNGNGHGHAEGGNGHGFAPVTSFLLRQGVDLEARDAEGNTVWMLTKRNALGAPTTSSRRRKLHQLLRILESAGAARVASHAV